MTFKNTKKHKIILLISVFICFCFLMIFIFYNKKEENSSVDLTSVISEENMVKTIDKISQTPRYIGTREIDSVCNYIDQELINMGYATNQQTFYFSKKKNEEAFRKRSNLHMYFNAPFNNDKSGIKGTNLIATKKGDTSDKTLIISAHYDSCEGSKGANDNGSGVAVLLETARILSNKQLPFNLEFVFFSGEELWFVGSRYFISQLSEKEKNGILGVINIDNIAEKSDLGYWVMVGEGKETEQEKGSYSFEPVENAMSKLFTSYDRFELTCQMNSDHYPFSIVGIPAVSITQDLTEGTSANSSHDTSNIIDSKRLNEIAGILLDSIHTLEGK